MTCVHHGGNMGSIFCRYCDLETIERNQTMNQADEDALGEREVLEECAAAIRRGE